MHTQLKCIFYIYFKYIYNLLFIYSYTVYMHIRNSIHAPPNPCQYDPVIILTIYTQLYHEVLLHSLAKILKENSSQYYFVYKTM